MFALAALSILTVWQGPGSSTVRPVFYFLTVSRFTSACQALWGKWERIDISLRCGNIRALSHIHAPTVFSRSSLRSTESKRCSVCVTQRLAHTRRRVNLYCLALRWGDVPAQAQSGAVVGEVVVGVGGWAREKGGGLSGAPSQHTGA